MGTEVPMSDVPVSEILQELEWRKYRDDPVAFMRDIWYIQHPERGAILFNLYEPQERALKVFQSERYIVTLKSRQIGWTTLVAAYAFWLACFHSDRLIIFISKGEREASTILRMVKYGYKRLPPWIRERLGKPLADNMTVMEFTNGSAIESLPSGSDPARGRSCYLIAVDEWAFLEKPEDAWSAIEPVADVGGRVFGFSTANGYGNFFYDVYTQATLGTNIFTPLFEPWSARGDRDADWYATKKRTLPAWQLHQEYPSSAEEAFIKSGNPYFDTDKLALLEVTEPLIGRIEPGDFKHFVEEPNGPLRMWEPPEPGETYVVGADVAEGLAHGDYSAAHVIRWSTHDVVAVWHGHRAPDEFAEVLSDLGTFYNAALLGVEVNNHGLTTCKYLLDAFRYPHIFRSRIVDERSKRVTNKIGWVTSKKTRPLMLDGLATELREETLGLKDRFTVAELRTFVRDEFGRLRGSPFDDRTMSLAIAVQMLQYSTMQQDQKPVAMWGTLQWWDSTLPKPSSKRTRIGEHNVREHV
jgi:Terminase large subunit, T4likevirus-type, N-terminal